MVAWPEPGTRVAVRYRRASGSVPPLTDAVGHLLTVEPVVRVRTKTGAVVEFAPDDVVALRVLTDTPVRTSQIRALEHAAARAWPGVEHTWLDGWLLRAAPGAGMTVNSALPLDISAHMSTLPAIVDWYRRRGLAPRLAIPDRLLSLPARLTTERTEQVLVRDVAGMATGDPAAAVTLSVRPDDGWLQTSRSGPDIQTLTAVTDGELRFGVQPGAAAARAAVTDAPDGARWVGLWVAAAGDAAAARRVCETLLAWAAGRGATRGYLAVGDDADPARTAVAGALGFRPHHSRRYFPVGASV